MFDMEHRQQGVDLTEMAILTNGYQPAREQIGERYYSFPAETFSRSA